VSGGKLRERDEPRGSRSLKRKEGGRRLARLISGGAFDRGERLLGVKIDSRRMWIETWVLGGERATEKHFL
jgi:hypothetical protein